MPTLDAILSEPTENSLAGKVENPGFFRRISSYIGGIGHNHNNPTVIHNYRKPSTAVRIAASILLLAAPLVEKLKAATYYINHGQSIQSFINDPNVVNGDEIIVSHGTYYENINFKGKNIILRSTDPNNHDVVARTIIDGMQKSRVITFENGEDDSCVLNGFTITNGYARGDYRSGYGGGIYCSESSPTITNCIISYNSAREFGGGMFSESATKIINCTFKRNVAETGGGILLTGSYRTLIKCTFIENYSAGYGGGIYDEGGSRLMNCILIGNFAGVVGGGIFQNASNSLLTQCTISGNSANIEREWGNVYGGGIYMMESILTLTNCIIWGNDGGQINGDDGATVTYSNVQGGWSGEGNTNVDPNFAKLGYWNNNGTPHDPEDDFFVEGDYHLKSQAGRWDPNRGSWTLDDVTSPCIDAGDPRSPIGYEPFPNGGVINQGAYGGTAEASKSYFGKPNCETIVAGDVNGDCKVDFLDLAFMANNWLRIIDSNYYLPPSGIN